MGGKRTFVLALSLAFALMMSTAGMATAHADKFIWKYRNAACYNNGMSARGIIIEQGTTGTTWMRITARFQRLVSGSWRTTKSKYVQSSVQFPNNHDDHKLASTFSFVNAPADYTHWTRISFRYQWFNNNVKIQQKVLKTGRC